MVIIEGGGGKITRRAQANSHTVEKTAKQKQKDRLRGVMNEKDGELLIGGGLRIRCPCVDQTPTGESLVEMRHNGGEQRENKGLIWDKSV